MSAVLELAEDCAAAYRATKLVTDDVLTEPIRRRIVLAAFDRAGLLIADDPARPIVEELADWEATATRPAPKVATLVTCRWCAGMWVALAIVGARRLAPRAWRPLARALTLSAAAALAAGLED